METELEKLKSDTTSLGMEIRTIKQHRENIQRGLAFLTECLQATDNRQQKMETFLAESSTNPKFIPQFIEQLEQEESVARNNGNVNFSSSTMLPFLKPKLLKLKAFKENESLFLRRAFEMIDDPNTDSIISWNGSGTSFFIHDKSKLKGLLLRYFGHDTIKNFISCLGAYGFKKVDSYLNEYTNERFQRGQRHMIKHIKKKPNKSETMKSLLEDMVAELKRLRDHLNTLINREISKMKQQEENTKTCLASAKEGLQQAKDKLKQIKEGPNSPFLLQKPPYRYKTEARPWLDPLKSIDKLRTDMEKLNVEILNMESTEESRMKYLIGLEGFFHSTDCRQQNLEVCMGETLRILGFDEEVRKKPTGVKFHRGKTTRRRKPILPQGKTSSTQSTYDPIAVDTHQTNITLLNSDDMLWAAELEDDLNSKFAEIESDSNVEELNTDEHFEPECQEISEDLNMWIKNLEKDLTCESEKNESSSYFSEQNTNQNVGSYSSENSEDLKNGVEKLENDMIAETGTHASYNPGSEHNIKENLGRSNSPVNYKDIDLWVSILEGDLIFE